MEDKDAKKKANKCVNCSKKLGLLKMRACFFQIVALQITRVLVF